MPPPHIKTKSALVQSSALGNWVLTISGDHLGTITLPGTQPIASSKNRTYGIMPGIYTPVSSSTHPHDRLQITFVLQRSAKAKKLKKTSSYGFGDTDEVTYTITNSGGQSDTSTV